MRWMTLVLVVATTLLASGTFGQLPPNMQGNQFPAPTPPRPTRTKAATFGGSTLPTTGIQSGVKPTSPGTNSPKSYSDYYNSSLKTYKRPPGTARDYTANKYFYHRPTISPYLNLTRRQSAVGQDNYHQYVVPELERRAKTTPPTTGLKSTTSPYYNQMYGH